ncbi:hypothetical protein ACFLUE_01275 [Chloroflexota bacterium]
MKKKVRLLKIGVIVTVVLSLATVVMVPPSVIPTVASAVGSEGLPISVGDFSGVPSSVIDDAVGLADGLFGEHQEKREDFVNQLLATYLEAKDKDFILFFNSGGWGWNLLEISPSWQTISAGIQSELDISGYSSVWLNYRRTVDTFRGHLDEIMSQVSLYPQKAKDLACRVKFLTNHIPDLRVILGGESLGTIICDSAMNIMQDNQRVYSIQTGPPFWYKNVMLDRTLVIRSGGIIPDAFSQGDIFKVICANLEAFFGFPVPDDGSGNILLYFRAPGHEYWWQDAAVSSRITDFLEQIPGSNST